MDPAIYNCFQIRAFRFWEYRSCCCLAPTSPIFTSDISNMVLYSIWFHPTRWSLSCSPLTRLETLHLDLEYDRSPPDWENRSLPLPTLSVLHSLITFRYNGFIKYLHNLMTRITSQIPRFISHIPKFQAFDEAHIGIDCYGFAAWIKFVSMRTTSILLKLDVSCDNLRRQFISLAQFCHSPFFPLPTLEYSVSMGVNICNAGNMTLKISNGSNLFTRFFQ